MYFFAFDAFYNSFFIWGKYFISAKSHITQFKCIKVTKNVPFNYSLKRHLLLNDFYLKAEFNFL